MEQNIVILALNGMLALSISMIGGRWYSHAILTNHKEVAWRVVHSSGIMAGIMLIVFSSLIPHVRLSGFWLNSFIWLIISGTWLFIIGVFTAAISGQRGLRTGTNLVNRLIYYAYLSASIFSLLGCIILISGLVNAL